MQKDKFYMLLENPEILDEKTENELLDLIVEYPYFQAALTLHLKNLKDLNSANYGERLQKVAIQVPQRKKLYFFLNSLNNTKKNQVVGFNPDEFISSFQLDNDKDFVQGNSLIDKFLSSDAGIKTTKFTIDKPLQQFENEVIKKSEQVNDEIITETLAMIFFQQKKYDKALDAFRKLSLKYPEKSIYFASRIDEIEKLKNI
jgi:tetratricopeptide (TPR) repeat protein